MMSWITRRAVFAICFGLGSAAWYLAAQRQSTPARAAQAIEASSTREANAQLKTEQPDEAPDPSIKFGPVEPMHGYVNADTVILRESADKSATVVARLKTSPSDEVTILDATRDFLRVRFAANDNSVFDGTERTRDYEGWAEWGSVMPELTAVILDAESGDVISRVPLSDGLISVAFSPDDSRALFFHNRDGLGSIGYEVRTSDYTLTRGLSSSDKYLGTLYYGPGDGDLYAAVLTPSGPNSREGKVNLVRVKEDGAVDVPFELDSSQSNFGISADGLTGFVARREKDSNSEMTVDVIDLGTLKLRNTFTFTGESLPADSGDFVLSRDGSELYIRLSEGAGSISVIDTRSGKQVREYHASALKEESYFGPESLLGDSLLLRVWDQSGEEMYTRSYMFWVGAKGSIPAERGIGHVADAGGKRYAINDEGTRLFRLDASNHIQERFVIPRPELHKGAPASDILSVFGFSASPDGKHLIMLIGEAHGC